MGLTLCPLLVSSSPWFAALPIAIQVQSPQAHSLPLLFLLTRMGHIQAGWLPPEPQQLKALRMGRQSGETVVSGYHPHFYHESFQNQQWKV